jgi:hypothetical protein
MNEYDDLFKKFDERQIVAQQDAGAPQPDPDSTMTKQVNKSKINVWIILIYVMVSFLASFGSGLYFTLKYPDMDQLKSNVSPQLIFTLYDSEDPDYPYGVSIDGTVNNLNNIMLPNMWVKVGLYSPDGTLLDTLLFEENEVPPNGYLVLNFDGTYVDPVYSYSVIDYGFEESDMFYILLNLSTVLICSLVYLFIDRSDFKKDRKTFFAKPLQYLGKIVGGYMIVYLALIISQVILQLLGGADSSANEQTIASMFSADPLALILLFMLLCVFTPITEELVFRKVIYGFFDRKFGIVVAVFLSGAIFGIMHVISFGDYIQAIPYVFMGAAFGFVYHWGNKNIFVTIGVHFINNFISFLYYFLLVYGITLF